MRDFGREQGINRLNRAPIEQPVTLDDVRQQLGITRADDTERDAVINMRIVAATRWAEQHTRTAFVNQKWTLTADKFSSSFDLKPPLKKIISVSYIAANGDREVLDRTKYLVDPVNSRLYAAYGQSWPSGRHQANAVQIEYSCGYGSALDVPMDIKEAIKFIVGHWENYQSSIEGAVRIQTIPYAVTQLLAPYVDMRNIF